MAPTAANLHRIDTGARHRLRCNGLDGEACG